jgi:hypothetical protein
VRISRKRMYHSPVWPLLVATLLFTSPLLLCAQNSAGDAEVTQLLAEARDEAAVLSRDADEMEALTRSEVSWQSHAAMLDTIKDDVNELGKCAAKLDASRDSASQWQRQAIDRMMPLLKELASNTTRRSTI